MVGDVKQSIYAFRGCNPEIFAKKYERLSFAKIITLYKNAVITGKNVITLLLLAKPPKIIT